MPLVKATLQAGIQAALDAAAAMEEGAVAARTMIASQIADAIHAYVSAADVNPGIPVATTGTAASHTGATTAKGSLS